MKQKKFKHLLAVYGTLKSGGFGNHRLIENSKFLGEQIIPCWRMYSLGGYPAINKANSDSSILIEVYEIDDPRTLDRVYSLEGYTGKRDDPSNWYDTDDVETQFGPAEIFYFKKSLEGDRPVIEDGVWRGNWKAAS